MNNISKLMKLFKRCDCGRKATWKYMPFNDWSNPYYCDKCVPRGCFCNEEDIREEYHREYFSNIYNTGAGLPLWPNEKIRWLNEFVWENVDELGRSLPCCEFWNIGTEKKD